MSEYEMRQKARAFLDIAREVIPVPMPKGWKSMGQPYMGVEYEDYHLRTIGMLNDFIAKEIYDDEDHVQLAILEARLDGTIEALEVYAEVEG